MKNISQKLVLFFYFLFTINGSYAAGMYGYVMPKHKFSNISKIFVDQINEDRNNPMSGMSKKRNLPLKNAGVKKTASIIYYFGEPVKNNVIITKISVHETKKKAIIHLLSLAYDSSNKGFIETDGIGDKAYQDKQELIVFVKGKVLVSLSSVNSSVSLHEFALTYANWMKIY